MPQGHLVLSFFVQFWPPGQVGAVCNRTGPKKRRFKNLENPIIHLKLNRPVSQNRRSIFKWSESRILSGFLLVRGVTCLNQDLLDWRIFRIINLVGLPAVVVQRLRLDTYIIAGVRFTIVR